MTGLNLETFLHLLRADLGAWTILGAVVSVVVLMAWTSWGSRRALRKCLVLSVTAHLGLALYGSTFLLVLLALQPKAAEDEVSRRRIRQIRVTPWSEAEEPPAGRSESAGGGAGTRLMPWDRPRESLALVDPDTEPPRPQRPGTSALDPVAVPTPEAPPLAAADAAPEVNVPTPSDPGPGPKPREREQSLTVPTEATPGAVDEVAPAVVAPRDQPEPAADARPPAEVANDPGTTPGVVKRPVDAVLLESALPEAEIRRRSRPDLSAEGGAASEAPRRSTEPGGPIALSRVLPGGLPQLPDIQGSSRLRRSNGVPEVYRSRLDPNRSTLAQRAGASAASEQAVERALDWLARHQDTDGRWDGATARYDDGTPVKGDDDYTIHCPPGETCFGECSYWEADTALTGLALLAYLGSGYTQADGKYSETVGKGLDFLLLQQKPDGDLRGRSRAVGMYCHAIATLALCEAYALTGEERLHAPVSRAIAFMVAARARDGLAWRYAPGAPAGDTSILGWVVLALKSARVVGIRIPNSDSVHSGTLRWLDQVASGPAHGLARYQPNDPVTPTMTAEAWVCRQFLTIGGPGPASTEASDYLLAHGPNRAPYNLYYWYYGTLAMYQHGGDAWTRWNADVRDQVVQRQRGSGHQAGSWDPDDSLYGAKGGRIYSTALATLTLEVYYRFLRLYDDPKLPAPTTGTAATPGPATNNPPPATLRSRPGPIR